MKCQAFSSSNWLLKTVLATLVLPCNAIVAEDAKFAERTFSFLYQQFGSFELNADRTSIIAVDNSANVGIIRDVTTAKRFEVVRVTCADRAVFSSDEKYIFVSRTDARITVLDAKTLKEIRTIPTDDDPSLHLRVAGNLLAKIGTLGKCSLYLVGEGGSLKHFATLKNVVATSRSNGTAKFVFLQTSGVLHSYDPKSLELSSVPTSATKLPSGLGDWFLSTDGRYLFGAHDSVRARLDLTKEKMEWERFLPNDADRLFDFVGESGTIFGSGGKVCYWDIKTRKVLASKQIDDDTILQVFSLAQPGTFVAALDNGTVVFFSLNVPK